MWRRLLTLDANNYDAAMDEMQRVAVRGIVLQDDCVLLIEGKKGELKFPGGGLEAGEDDRQALLREMMEETGYAVRPDSLQPFGEVEEKRRSVHVEERKIYHQLSRYYFCAITGVQRPCSYTDHEKRFGFHPVWLPLEQSLAQYERNRKNPAHTWWTWQERDSRVLRLVKEAVAEKKVPPLPSHGRNP